jgi:hypothetical protein
MPQLPLWWRAGKPRVLVGRIVIQPLRSFLFAPGNRARRVEQALSLDADPVIVYQARRVLEKVSALRARERQ